jgi:hypothetical protein
MRSLALLLLCSVLAPAALNAQRVQLGAAVEWRGQLGTTSTTSDRRSGLAARLMANGFLRPTTDWRLDVAYSQMKYDRRDEFGVVPINESGLEIGGYLRQSLWPIARARPYIVAGAIASLRMSCGVDTAFDSSNIIECEGRDEFLLGWGAGLGARTEFIGGWDWFFEARLLGNVTSAAGGRLLAIGLGAAF